MDQVFTFYALPFFLKTLKKLADVRIQGSLQPIGDLCKTVGRLFPVLELGLFGLKSLERDDPGGVDERFFMFSDLIDKPGELGRFLAVGAAVNNDEHQEEVPVFDCVQEVLKSLPVVVSGL